MEAKEFFEEKKSNMRELSNLSDVQRDMVCSLMEQYVALHIADVVGRSEQLVCVGCGRTEQQHTGNGKDICPNYGGRFKAN